MSAPITPSGIAADRDAWRAGQVTVTQAQAELVVCIRVLLEKHIAYHNSIEHAAARELLRKVEGAA